MSQTLFTIGYERRSLEEYVAILRAHHISVLIDVRETAWSHKPGFSKRVLQSTLEKVGIHYVHASYAGNPKWLRGEAASHSECLAWYEWYVGEFDEIIHEFRHLVNSFFRAQERVCITCFERHAEDCHRAIIAERWRGLDSGTVEHLAIDGCKRLTESR